MQNAKYFTLDGRTYLWKDLLELRRAQLEAIYSNRATQLALFESLHEDHRPEEDKSASDRYLQPGLF